MTATNKARPSPSAKRAAAMPAEKHGLPVRRTAAKKAGAVTVLKVKVGKPAKRIGGKLSFAEFVYEIGKATPMELVETERQGVRGRLVKDMATNLRIPRDRFYGILGVAKATVEKKAADDSSLTGAGGYAAVRVARLMDIAQSILAESTDPAAAQTDANEWLGRWLETPQPALAGKKPADLLDTPTGADVVARALGAMLSGAFL